MSKGQTRADGARDADYDIEQEDNRIFYRDRAEWKDVIPIPDKSPRVSLMWYHYCPKAVEMFDYFRAVLRSGEKTQRVLGLTADAISLTPYDSRVWEYRREVLQALGIPCLMTKNGIANKEFVEELEFSRELIEENQKNYQVWHHRKILVSWAAGFNEETGKSTLECKDARQQLSMQELELTRQFLTNDPNNDHAWQHRQWVFETLGGDFKKELNYVDMLLNEDLANESAWNQRYFVIYKSCEITQELISREIKFTWSQILKASSNEGPWTYLIDILRITEDLPPGTSDEMLQKCINLYNTGVRDVPMLNFMLELYEDRLTAKTSGEEAYDHALEICESLEEDLDKVRRIYWTCVKRRLISKFEFDPDQCKESESTGDKPSEVLGEGSCS